MKGFVDRADAGRRLAAELAGYATKRPIVLGLPRGGVVVAYEIARALSAELDLWLVRKIGVPWQPELGMGAVAEGRYVHLNQDIVAALGLAEEDVARATAAEHEEVERRVRKFRGDRPRPKLTGRVVILVDDGIATGGTVRVAVRSIRAERPSELVIAVPVAAPETLRALALEVDRVVCLLAPPGLGAIGQWYEDFSQVSDDAVVELLTNNAFEGP